MNYKLTSLYLCIKYNSDITIYSMGKVNPDIYSV